MKHYYIVPIIGTGTREDPIRPDLPVGVNYSASIPTDVLGNRLRNICIVMVSAPDNVHAQIASDTKYGHLVDRTDLTIVWNTLANNVKNRVNNVLTKYAIPNILNNDQRILYQILQDIGISWGETTFDPVGLDAS